MSLRDIENVKKLVALDYPEVTSFRCVEVTIPDDDKYLHVLAGFISLLGDSWSWWGDRNDRISRAALWRTAYSLTTWDRCMNCEELIECLQPLFDAIDARFNSLDAAVSGIATTTDFLQSNLESNAAMGTNLPAEAVLDALCAGALALVKAMDTENRKLYAEAEASSVDNAAEWITTILDLFPSFSAQGVNSGAELANAYFENQVVAYEADYPDFEQPAADYLRCLISANGGILTYDVWGWWLLGVIQLFDPANAAANVFTRYAPLRQTWLNQLAELFNREESLQSYFDRLWNAYFTGTQNPVMGCTVCDDPCLIPYTLDEGTESMGVITPSAETFGERLDGAGDAYKRSTVFVFDLPIMKLSVNFEWVGGTHDGVFGRATNGSVVSNEADDTGTLIMTSETPQRVWYVDTGYSAVVGTYTTRYAELSNVSGCLLNEV